LIVRTNRSAWAFKFGDRGGSFTDFTPLAANRHGQVQAGRLSGIDVARIVKKLADRAGLDAARYAGHSLRAGHATSAAIAGASERSIMRQTGHRSVQMVRRYIRDGNLFRDNSGGKLGL
jgi:integrase